MRRRRLTWAVALLAGLAAALTAVVAMVPDPPRRERLYLQPLGAVRATDLRILEEDLAADHELVVLPAVPLPAEAWWRERGQYRAKSVLSFVKRTAPADGRVLAVADVDATIPELNFVFGLADCPGRIATVYCRRLRHQANEAQWKHRLIVTARHELGHTHGLRHCPDESCLMHLSNTALATDEKQVTPCRRCARRL